MTIEEYNEKHKIIFDDFELKKRELLKEYALSNDSYNIGDIFEDHCGKIKIEKKQFYFHETTYSIPSSMMYFGESYNKNGTINKKYPKRWAYQLNNTKAKK